MLNASTDGDHAVLGEPVVEVHLPSRLVTQGSRPALPRGEDVRLAVAVEGVRAQGVDRRAGVGVERTPSSTLNTG